ncbi:MAG: hypothetical protein IT329_00505 [Caldilineaceae bacterium]|nr:hypothetical protein [Caldilineaceae bacterium]
MFSRTIPRVWRAVFLFLVAAGILLLPASHPRSLIAQTESADETVAEEPNPAVVFYTKALNVSEEEAWRRLMLQGPMIEVGNKIAEAEPTYAGSWLQHEPEFRLVIALTAPEGQAIVAPYLQGVEWANAVEVVQRPKTIAELEALLNQVGEVTSRVEGVSDLLYGMGLNIPEGKVQFYSPTPEVLRDVLGRAPAFRAAPVALEEMEFVFQAQRLEPAVLRYPYLLGGTFLDGCTASFPVFRHADLRRYMSTAGHCPNHITVQHPSAPSTMSGIYLGPVVTENNPFVTPPVGPRGRQADFQAHATTVRDFDLTNMIRINSTENRRVVSSTRKATTWGAAVCKYGRSSGSTCGFVTNINYRPVDTWGDAFTYVLVGTPFPGEFACPGDSGAPVFLFVDGGPNVAGLGILAASEAGPCDGSSQSFAYTLDIRT